MNGHKELQKARCFYYMGGFKPKTQLTCKCRKPIENLAIFIPGFLRIISIGTYCQEEMFNYARLHSDYKPFVHHAILIAMVHEGRVRIVSYDYMGNNTLNNPCFHNSFDIESLKTSILHRTSDNLFKNYSPKFDVTLSKPYLGELLI